MEMAHRLSALEIEEMKSAFKLFDKDGDGTITTTELNTVLNSLGKRANKDKLQEMMKEVNKNDKGTINFTEFMAMMTKGSHDRSQQDEMRDSFRMFDKDGNGLISATELKSVMAKLGQHLDASQISEMIQDADIDGDGQVNYEEFVIMMSYKE